MRPRLYISGPYTAATPHKTDENINCARSRMIEAMLSGWWPRCPHTHTARMERDAPEISWDEWLELAWAHLAGMPIYTEFDMDRDARYFRGQHLPDPQTIVFEQLSGCDQECRQSPMMIKSIRRSVELAEVEILRLVDEGRIPDPVDYRGSDLGEVKR